MGRSESGGSAAAEPTRYSLRRRTSTRGSGGVGGDPSPLAKLLELAAGCRNVVVFSGSGLSAPSGMSTFSTKGGLYEKAARRFGLADGMRLFHYAFFDKQRLEALAFFADIYAEAVAAAPAAGHRALAGMAAAGKLLRHYTLNIDGLGEAVGMDTWHPENNPTGVTVEMHGSVRQLVCPSCGHIVALTPGAARTLKARQPLSCGQCGHAPIRLRVMLYDDAEDWVITPETVYEVMEEDMAVADLVLWVGISFEQSASTQYFRNVRTMIAEVGRLREVRQALINPSDEVLWNLLSACSNTGELEVLEVLLPADMALPPLAAALAIGTPLEQHLAAEATSAAAATAAAPTAAARVAAAPAAEERRASGRRVRSAAGAGSLSASPAPTAPAVESLKPLLARPNSAPPLLLPEGAPTGLEAALRKTASDAAAAAAVVAEQASATQTADMQAGTLPPSKRLRTDDGSRGQPLHMVSQPDLHSLHVSSSVELPTAAISAPSSNGVDRPRAAISRLRPSPLGPAPANGSSGSGASGNGGGLLAALRAAATSENAAIAAGSALDLSAMHAARQRCEDTAQPALKNGMSAHSQPDTSQPPDAAACSGGSPGRALPQLPPRPMPAIGATSAPHAAEVLALHQRLQPQLVAKLKSQCGPSSEPLQPPTSSLQAATAAAQAASFGPASAKSHQTSASPAAAAFAPLHLPAHSVAAAAACRAQPSGTAAALPALPKLPAGGRRPRSERGRPILPPLTPDISDAHDAREGDGAETASAVNHVQQSLHQRVLVASAAVAGQADSERPAADSERPAADARAGNALALQHDSGSGARTAEPGSGDAAGGRHRTS